MYLNGEDSQGLSYEKEVKANGVTEHKHYLSAGGIVFAMQVTRNLSLVAAANPATANTSLASLRYLHHDHLGSVAAVTSDTGAVLERLAFDPWGKRRNVNGQADVTDALVGQTTDRGYTEHEHLDEMGIIHMNGRVYDPLVGRMMSADPFIQAPGSLQSYNRYSYVMNNPLNLTDPSGYSWNPLKDIRDTFRAIDTFVRSPTVNNAFNVHRSMPGIQAADTYVQNNRWAYALGSAIVYYYGGSVGVALHATYNARVATGSANAAFRVGAVSLVTSTAFSAVGANFAAGSLGSYLGHAAVGCAAAAAQGGKCGAGAASALFGKFASNVTSDLGNDVGHFAVTVVAGGVGSVIAGGKFENGAKTAAYGYLFNFLLSRNQTFNKSGYGKEIFSIRTSFAPEQDALGSVVRGTAGRLYDAALFAEGVYEDLKCGNTDCYGTRSLNQSDQKNAMQETERQIRAAVDSYVSNNSADPGNLTRVQMVDLVKSFDNIPNFSKHYGGSQTIIERFQIKELKPTCAPGDTTC